MLDISGMARVCGITRPTIYKWLAFDVLQAEVNEKIGPRQVVAFREEYGAAVAKILDDHRRRHGSGPGIEILTDEVKAKIEQLNERFYPERYK